MDRVNLSGTGPDTLAKAVVKMKRVDLWGARLTTDQINVLCDVIVREEKWVEDIHVLCDILFGRVKRLALEHMDLRGVNLGQVDALKLARAIVKMKTVKLSGTHLTTNQLKVLCRTIVCEKNMALKDLRLVGVGLDRVDKDLVDRVRTVVNIETY